MSHRVKIALLVAAVCAGLVYAARRIAASAEWQRFDLEHVRASFLHLKVPYLLLAAACIFASYLFRSLRWREFLRPMREGRLGAIYEATLIGFSAVALLGRPGEVVRPWLIARKEGLSLTSQIGAWALERVFDGLTLGGLLGAALFLFPAQYPLAGADTQLADSLHQAGLAVFLGAVALGVAVLQFRRRQKFFLAVLRWVIRPLPARFQSALEAMVDHFAMGIGALDSISALLRCTAHSLLVWLTLLLSYVCIARAMGAPMSLLGWEALVVVTIASVIGSLAHLPGVGGGTQVASAVALNQLFGIPLAVASTAAILFWALAFLAVLIPGLPLAAHEGLDWRRLRRVARQGLEQR